MDDVYFGVPEAGDCMSECIHCGAEIAPSHPGRWVDEQGSPDCGLYARTVHEPYQGAAGTRDPVCVADLN
jgi:hypothetical protein